MLGLSLCVTLLDKKTLLEHHRVEVEDKSRSKFFIVVYSLGCILDRSSKWVPSCKDPPLITNTWASVVFPFCELRFVDLNFPVFASNGVTVTTFFDRLDAHLTCVLHVTSCNASVSQSQISPIILWHHHRIDSPLKHSSSMHSSIRFTFGSRSVVLRWGQDEIHSNFAGVWKGGGSARWLLVKSAAPPQPRI